MAFDVHEHVCGGYFCRLAVGLFAQWHLNRFVLRAADALQNADPEAFRARYGGRREAWARVRPLLWLALRLLFPEVIATYLPWYTPHRIAMPAEATALGARYSEMALPAATAAKSG